MRMAPYLVLPVILSMQLPAVVSEPVPQNPPVIVATDVPKAAVRRDLAVRPGEEYTQAEGYYINNKLIITRSYWKDGELYNETLFKDGKKEGPERYWYKNGQIRSERFYKNDLLDGTCRWWSNSGKFTGTFEMKNGTGVVKEWYPDGTVKEETPFRDGLPHGIAFSYHPNGRKKQECGKSEGRNHGVLILWNEKGGLTDGSPYFFVRGLERTREEYLEARLQDPTLPLPPN